MTIRFFALALPLTAALVLPVAAQNRTENDRTTINQIVAREDARIAQLKANLKLADDQQDDWNRFEAALKDISRKRAERSIKIREEQDKRDAEKDGKPLTHAEALRRHADALTFRAEEIRALADAAEPISAKLSEAQRRRVDEVIRSYVQAPFVSDGPVRRR
ncbi:MAG: Spy/CpxP family protein refolding chaperone [Xanthobacteraceae bacterium]